MNLLMVIPRYKLTREKYYDYPFPLGLAYISAALKKGGYSVDVLNMNHFSGASEDILNRKLGSKKYHFVLTGNNALGYEITRIILETSRKHYSKPKIILGGPIITSEPDFIFSDLKPDFAVIGEGEETIVALLRAIESGRDLREIEGIMYWNCQKAVKTKARKPILNLDSIPLPDVESFQIEKQFENMHTNVSYYTNLNDNPRVYPILASRSCPYKCTFCYHDSIYRKRTIQNVMGEIEEAVKKYDINVIEIYDECFAIDEKRVIGFCRRMKRLRENASWEIHWTCQMRVENISHELLKLMKESGCIAISYGFESYSKKVLDSMKKDITPEQIKKAIKETMDAKINIQGNFIFGDVAETKDTAKETLDYWKKNCCGQVNLTFVQPYPGSEIYRHCLRKGIIKNKADFIKNEITGRLFLNMTDKMSDEDVANLKREMLLAISKHSEFARPQDIFQERENNYSVVVKCPYCHEITRYKNCLIENKHSYGFTLVCRKCFKHFFVVSFLQKMLYQHYTAVRGIIEAYLSFRTYLNKRRS